MCDCIMHKGPHWLYMDFLAKERNMAHFERLVLDLEKGNVDDFAGAWELYTRSEEARANEKQRNMEQEDRERGEAGSYPHTLLGIDERVERLEQKRRALLDRYLNWRRAHAH